MRIQTQTIDAESKELLCKTSAPAQALRRSLLRNSNFLIIGGGPARNAFFYQRIVQLGIRVYIADAPSTVWPKQVSKEFLSGFIPFDFSNLSDLGPRFIAALYEEEDAPSSFDAALSFDESHLIPAAMLAEDLALPFQSIEAVKAAQNKATMRAKLDEAGIPSPQFTLVRSEAEAVESVRKLGAPLIIKPTNGFHSAGVQQADSEEEAAAAFRYASETVKPDEDIAWGQCGDIIAENFLPGPETDIDVLMSDGDAVYANVVDNWPSVAPWFEEHGFDAPSLVSQAMQEEICDHVVTCIQALGFEHGLFHAEVRYTEDGPRLLEINPRIGGGPIFQIHRAVWGVDLVEELCFIAVGIPSRPISAPQPRMRCVATCFPSPFSGLVEKNGWLAWVREFDGRVISFIEFFQEGEKVVGAHLNFPDNLGHLVVGAATRAECLKVLHKIYEKLENPVLPEEGNWPKTFQLNAP